jgi:hypothetical protein
MFKPYCVEYKRRMLERLGTKRICHHKTSEHKSQGRGDGGRGGGLWNWCVDNQFFHGLSSHFLWSGDFSIGQPQKIKMLRSDHVFFHRPPQTLRHLNCDHRTTTTCWTSYDMHSMIMLGSPVHCPYNRPHITFYRADAKDAILYSP